MKRVTHVYLTEQGKQHSDVVLSFLTDDQKGFGNFTEEELQQAKRIFQKLIRQLEQCFMLREV